jgi:hypothetical protein
MAKKAKATKTTSAEPAAQTRPTEPVVAETPLLVPTTEKALAQPPLVTPIGQSRPEPAVVEIALDHNDGLLQRLLAPDVESEGIKILRRNDQPSAGLSTYVLHVPVRALPVSVVVETNATNEAKAAEIQREIG